MGCGTSKLIKELADIEASYQELQKENLELQAETDKLGEGNRKHQNVINQQADEIKEQREEIKHQEGIVVGLSLALLLLMTVLTHWRRALSSTRL